MERHFILMVKSYCTTWEGIKPYCFEFTMSCLNYPSIKDINKKACEVYFGIFETRPISTSLSNIIELSTEDFLNFKN